MCNFYMPLPVACPVLSGTSAAIVYKGKQKYRAGKKGKKNISLRLHGIFVEF